jgi:hypothetical protein
VSGPPMAVLRWLWNREGAGEPSSVTVNGAPEAVEELRRCIVTATQWGRPPVLSDGMEHRGGFQHRLNPIRGDHLDTMLTIWT